MKKTLSAILAVGALFCFNQQTDAAAFYLIDHSVSAMGTAYAGASALAEDPSTIYFNPAGMTYICGTKYSSSYQYIIPTAEFDNDDSVYFLGGTLDGDDGGDAGENALLPSTYIMRNCGCWAFGLAINSPFGLATNYNDNWVGRYHANHSKLLTINIQPSVAYRFNRCWSIGAGLDVQYIHAKLTNKVDFGGIVFALTSGNFGIPQEQDGKVQVKGNNWGVGGNIGVIYEPCCGTRFGLHYRSEIKHSLEGKEKFRDIPVYEGEGSSTVNATVAALFHDTRVRADVTLPSQLSFAAYHEFNCCWAAVADITWFKWNVVPRLRFRFNNDLQDDQIVTLKWKNTFRYGLGVIYTPNCCWKFRTGVAYDESPARSKKYQNARVPDADRLWTAFGIGYRWNRCFEFDFGYAHLFVPHKPKVFQDATGENTFRGGLRGEWNSYADIVSLQTVWTF